MTDQVRLGDALATASKVLSTTLAQFMAELTPTKTGTVRVPTRVPAADAQQAYTSLAAAALSFGTEIVHMLEQARMGSSVQRDDFASEIARFARGVTGDVLRVANNAVPAAGSGPTSGRVRSVQVDLKYREDGKYWWQEGTLWVSNNLGEDAKGTEVSLVSTALLGPDGLTDGVLRFVDSSNVDGANGVPPSGGKWQRFVSWVVRLFRRAGTSRESSGRTADEPISTIKFVLNGDRHQRIDFEVRIREPKPPLDDHDGERRYHAVIRVQRPAAPPAGPDVDTCVLVTAVMRRRRALDAGDEPAKNS